MKKNRTNRRYWFILSALFIGLVLLEYYRPRPLDWQRSYSKDDTIPYGTYLLFESLESYFAQPASVNRRSLYEVVYEETFAPQNLFFICQRFEPDSLDTQALKNAVSSGAHAFIATEYLGDYLTDFLGVRLRTDWAFSDDDEDTDEHQKEETGIYFLENFIDEERYLYFFRKGSTASYFTYLKEDTLVVALGQNAKDKVNFLKVPHGKGYFWLHANPLLFTNYSMVQEIPRNYLEKSLSQLPSAPILWDSYYTLGRKEARTPLRFILANDALRWAYYLCTVAFLLFVLFESKRRQRVIPVVRSPTNTTLEFVETIGQMYFQKKQHTDLALKKIQFFKAFLREHFFVQTAVLNAQVAEKIAARTACNVGDLYALFNLIERIEHAPHPLTEDELLRLSERIEAVKAHMRTH